MEVKYSNYQNKPVLLVDFSGCYSDHDVEEVMRKSFRLLEINRNSNLLILYNLSTAVFTKTSLKLALKLFGQFDYKVSKRAFVINNENEETILSHFLRRAKTKGKTEIHTSISTAINFLVFD